jgi:hypothetical protein
MQAWGFEKIWPNFGILSIFADKINIRKITQSTEKNLTVPVGYMYYLFNHMPLVTRRYSGRVVVPHAGMWIEIVVGAICRLSLERCRVGNAPEILYSRRCAYGVWSQTPGLGGVRLFFPAGNESGAGVV